MHSIYLYQSVVKSLYAYPPAHTHLLTISPAETCVSELPAISMHTMSFVTDWANEARRSVLTVQENYTRW